MGQWLDQLREVAQNYAKRPGSVGGDRSLAKMLLSAGASGVADAVTVPRDVMAGTLDPMSDEGMGRVLNMAGMAVTGGVPVATPVAAGETLLGSALTRQARNVDELKAALATEHPNLKFAVSEREGGPVVVNSVVVPPELRGQGEGSRFMRDVLDYADENGRAAALTPEPFLGGSKAKLERWYGDMGFEKNKGRKRDFSISEAMVRQPGGKR